MDPCQWIILFRSNAKGELFSDLEIERVQRSREAIVTSFRFTFSVTECANHLFPDNS